MTNRNPKPTSQMSDATRLRLEAALAGGRDETNPQFLFSLTATDLLLAVVNGLVDPGLLARRELANRGLDQDGAWVGFPRAREIHLGVAADVSKAPDTAAEQAVAEIARRVLHLDTIETQNSDSLDFHEIAVWAVREALLAAYSAGANANGHANEQEG